MEIQEKKARPIAAAEAEKSPTRAKLLHKKESAKDVVDPVKEEPLAEALETV